MSETQEARVMRSRAEDTFVNTLVLREVTWIEIELIGMDNKPIPQEKYRVTLPDGRQIEGQLDDKGCARVEGFYGQKCLVTFPDLDKDAWEDKDADPKTH